MTHREFCILCEESVEQTHDDNEREAMYAIMHAAAQRGKGKNGKLPSLSDLYKRPSGDGLTPKEKESEDALEKHKKAEEWLSQFDLSALAEQSDED